MKIFTKKEILPFSLIFLAFIAGFILYPYLPDKVPSHWNAKGEVDSWSSKNFAVLFFPTLTLVIYLLMIFIPFIDPLRKNYPKFAIPYFWMRTIFVIFFTLLYFYTLWPEFGTRLNIGYFMVSIFSIFFIILGLLLPKIKKNYFVGIRTPWTIHSERVWEKTHQFSGKIFVLAGIISLLGLLMIDYAFVIFFTAILSAAFVSLIYSYLIFRKIEKF